MRRFGSHRRLKSLPGNRPVRLNLERLEARETPAIIVTQTFRPLDFKIAGSYSGTTTGPGYNDAFSGTVAGTGHENYTSATQGLGSVTGGGSGQGVDSFRSYSFAFSGSAKVTDNGGSFATTPTSHSFHYTSGYTGSIGGGGDPFSVSAAGTFNPNDYSATIAWNQNISGFQTSGTFQGNLTQTTTAATDLTIASASLVNCNLTFQLNVTGQLMHADTEDTPATKVQVFYGDGLGTIIGTPLAEIPVFWNSGTIKAVVSGDDLPTPPADAREIIVVADPDHVVSESNETNNTKSIALPSLHGFLAPVVVFTYPKTVNEGDPGKIPLSFAVSKGGPNGPDCIHYAFDLNGDGIFELGGDSYDTALPDSSLTLPDDFVADGPKAQQIFARAYGKFGGESTFSVVITVKNVAPTATFAGPVAEGTSSTVSFTNQDDASAVDAAAGFHYAYDFNNDGKWDVGDGTYVGSDFPASQDIPAAMLPDGNAKKFVKGRIIDKDGGFTDYLVNVSNVSPTASLGNNGPIGEGGSATVSFSNQFDPSATDTTAGFHYCYDFNNDGHWNVGSPTYAGGVKNASTSFKILDEGDVTVRARIMDKDGGFSEYFTTITANPVAPTAAFTNNVKGQVKENGAATVSFVSQTDPSPVDVAKHFRYAFDFNNDGTWDLGDGTYVGGKIVVPPSVAVPAALLADGPSTLTVKGRILDEDGQFTDCTTTIQVLNVAPTASLKNDGPKGVGQNVTFTFSGMTDVSAADRLAGFQFSFDYLNNGTFSDNGTNHIATHAFDKAGTYKVVGRIQDKDGGTHDYFTTVTVR